MTSIAVLIATSGRPECVGRHIARLHAQTRPPEHIFLSVASKDDLPPNVDSLPGVSWTVGPRGLCAQRNTGLALIRERYDYVAMLDDDYVPSRHTIARMIAFLDSRPDVVGANGILLADGAQGPGISYDAAEQMLEAYDAKPAPEPVVEKSGLYGLYGCNMVFRVAALTDLKFDDRLKLYGWQEDIDFSAQLRPRGLLVKTVAFAGVHLAEKRGRVSGVKLGYSQVVNPAYLAAKGTMRRSYAIRIVLRSVIANHLRVVRPEPWIDRGGRIKGNWMGFVDCLRGRFTPERIEAL